MRLDLLPIHVDRFFAEILQLDGQHHALVGVDDLGGIDEIIVPEGRRHRELRQFLRLAVHGQLILPSSEAVSDTLYFVPLALVWAL